MDKLQAPRPRLHSNQSITVRHMRVLYLERYASGYAANCAKYMHARCTGRRAGAQSSCACPCHR